MGCTPALGIDLDTAFGSDLFGEMHALFGQQRSAMRYRRFRDEANVPAPISVEAVLEAATINGARAAGLEGAIGTLTPGKQADIIMVRTNGVAVFPVTNAIGTIVQAVERSDVDTVMVAGEDPQARRQAGRRRSREADGRCERLARLSAQGERLPAGPVQEIRRDRRRTDPKAPPGRRAAPQSLSTELHGGCHVST